MVKNIVAKQNFFYICRVVCTLESSLVATYRNYIVNFTHNNKPSMPLNDAHLGGVFI